MIMSKLEESIGRAATKIAEDIEANCIVSIEQTIKEVHEFEQDYLHTEVKVTIFRNVSSGYNKFEFITKIKKEHASIIPIKEILIEAIRPVEDEDALSIWADKFQGSQNYARRIMQFREKANDEAKQGDTVSARVKTQLHDLIRGEGTNQENLNS